MSTDVLRSPLVSEGRTLIDDLLGEQQLLTPVAIFSRKHERPAVPAQATSDHHHARQQATNRASVEEER
jgi:hypothetical protein